ncbi:MAG: methyltransferase domain-containing protein [Asgard group archaeon]|nr:methyltransferase domain-containing protein [Asgard group archaeon]
MDSVNENSSIDATILFQLSGLHESLPSFEIQSLLESSKTKFTIVEKRKNVVLINCSLEIATIVAEKAAYCKRAIRVLYSNELIQLSVDRILNDISTSIDFRKHLLPLESFQVRLYHTSKVTKDIKSIDLESTLGKRITTQTNEKNSASMKSPDKRFVIILNDDKYYFGLEIFEQEKGSFNDRRPDLRPYFKPGTLEPRFARLMANLAKTPPNGYLLDPFCGPGGILIESALMGNNVIGIDIDRRMINGAKRNLIHYTPKINYELLIGDARSLPFNNSIDSIATDPPYGRSTSTHGKEVMKLLEQFFEEAYNVLTNNGTLAVGMFVEIPIEEIADKYGFKVEIFEKIYIHKSLTRRVGVFSKK